MENGVCGDIGSDTTVLANSGLSSVANDGYNLGITAMAKGGIQAGKGNAATKSIIEPLKGATNISSSIVVGFPNAAKSLPNLAQFQAISQSH